MKKLYKKPFIAVESFQLNAAIAASCSSMQLTPINHSVNGCDLEDEKPGEYMIGAGCDVNVIYPTADNEDGICYQAMEGFVANYLES